MNEPQRLVDEAIDAYVDWPEDHASVCDAYVRWTSAQVRRLPVGLRA